ncbi:MAG: flagellar protein FlaG [Spirochaetaceae bacterium]|jgi:flagellar protein FlaG|nr:flagellar protein FlaG [Spirochaetaceae bacterium]
MNSIVNVAETGLPSQFTQTAKRKSDAVFGTENGGRIIDNSESVQDGALSEKNAEKEIANLERISRAFNKKLQFVLNHESAEITINVIDPDTDKVIKVLPPEELQRLNRKIEDAIGFLFDEKV